MAIHFIGGPLPAKSVMSFQLFGPATVRKMTPEEEAQGKRLDELACLSDQDEWWLEKRIGRLDGLHDPRAKLSDEKIAKYLAALRQVFDNAWWRSICQRRKHGRNDPLGFFGGQDVMFRLLRLGECLYVLGSADKLSQETIKRLKLPSEYVRAATEVEVATCFVQAGFLVEMYPLIVSQKRPEGKVVVDGQTLYYEVTEEAWTMVQREVFKAENVISKWLSDTFGPVNGILQFTPKSIPRMQRARSAIDAMKQQSLKQGLPFTIQDDNLTAKLDKAVGQGGWVGLSGLEPEPSEIVQRWVKSLFQKSKQLPASEAGVIIASPLFLWGGMEVQAASTTLTQELTKQPHTRVCGIIFAAKHVESSGFIRHVPNAVNNPRAQIHCDEALGKMAQALFAYPDWM